MSLDFEQKQLLRSISNLVVNHPELVKAALLMRNLDDSLLFMHLEPVFRMIKSTPYIPDDYKVKAFYFNELSEAIQEIKDAEIKKFFNESTKEVSSFGNSVHHSY